jgi:hypothetical protein
MKVVTDRQKELSMKRSTTVESGWRGKTATLKSACVGTCQEVLGQLARVRASLYSEWRSALAVPERVLRLTLNEAEALAWQTSVPHLVFPLLAEEKMRATAAWSVRQRSLQLGRRGDR